MEVNLPYYVNTMKLPVSKALFPLFEAISNSIDSIEENREVNNFDQDGEIIVSLFRNPQDSLLGDSEENREQVAIQSISIKDNGIGFTNQNFQAFSELSSEKKKRRGGKGLGRVCWLKVFEKAVINSTYKDENSSVSNIYFEFKCEDNPFSPIKIKKSIVSNKIETEVKLINCKKPYNESLPKRRSTIADEIITHFLPLYMVANPPNIIIKEEGLEDLVLDNVFEDFIAEKGNKDIFEIYGKEFIVIHAKTKYHSQRNKNHRIYYIANGRVVEEDNLSQEKVANIPIKLELDGENQVYVGYVESSYLDENVNQSRDGFDIPDKKDENNLLPSINKEAITTEIYKLAGRYLNDYIEKTRKEKNRKIKEYIDKEAPNYAYLYKYHKEDLNKIPFINVQKGKIERELYQIHYEKKTQFKKEIESLSSIPDGQISPEEYKLKVKYLLENLNPTGKADLAEYIIDRKIILELITKALGEDSEKKFTREDVIHSYIFPIKSSSDEVTSKDHNLWLLDERLALNTYISSDKQFNQIQGFEDVDTEDGKKRPDLLAIAFSTIEPEQTSPPYRLLDIFEFKKPMRDDYSKDENPIEQILDYINIIRENEAKDRRGRDLKVIQEGIIYGHIVCDITKSLKGILLQNDFARVGEEDWYIRFHTSYNALIEVISFDQMLNVALKRNKALFDKLGI